MPKGELFQRFTAHELLIEWPAYFECRRRIEEREAAQKKGKPETVMGG